MKPFVTFILLLSLLLPVRAQQAPLSMEQAIQLAIENDFQLEIGRNELEVAKNNNDWSVAGRYPTIDATINSDNGYSNVSNPASVVIETNRTNLGVTPAVNLNWVLFDGFRIRFSKQQLEQLEALSAGNFRLTLEATVQNVMLAYYGALAEKENLKVLEETLNLSRDRINYENLRKEYGQASTFDILQSRDAYFNDSTNYLVQVTNYDNALRNLNLAMGLDDLDRRFVLTDTLVYDPYDYTYDQLETAVLSNNVALQNLFVNRDLAATNSALQRADRYPRLSAGAGVSYNVGIADGTQTFNFGGAPDQREIPSIAAKTFNASVGFTLSYRITDFGARRRRIESAQLQEITAQLDIKDLQRELRTVLANTHANYQNRIELLELTEASLENARQNLQIATERFRGGLINSFDFRLVQLSFIDASQARLLAIFNLKTTETELLRLAGELVKYGD